MNKAKTNYSSGVLGGAMYVDIRSRVQPWASSKLTLTCVEWGAGISEVHMLAGL